MCPGKDIALLMLQSFALHYEKRKGQWYVQNISNKNVTPYPEFTLYSLSDSKPMNGSNETSNDGEQAMVTVSDVFSENVRG